MTPDSIKPLVSKHLGISSVDLDDQYAASYLSAVQDANQRVANDLLYPLAVSDQDSTTGNVPYPSGIDPDSVASVSVDHPIYGRYNLVRFNLDEAIRRFGSYDPPVGKPIAFIPIAGPTMVVRPAPSMVAVATYTFTYVPNVRGVISTGELLNGAAKNWHELVAFVAAILLLEGDSNTANQARIAALQQEYATQRVQAFRVLHRNSPLSGMVKSLVPDAMVTK